MSRSWKLGSLFGINVYVHITWLLLPLLIVIASSAVGWLDGVFHLALVITVFACVVLHELGHALTARYYGIGTRDITLYPIGGVARLEGMPDRPSHELLVAIAGPLVNVLIALGLTPLVWGVILTRGMPPAEVEDAVALGLGTTALLFGLYVWILNVGLVLFNMLPTFPMDGGRVLRAVLAMRLNLVRATEWAVTVGRVIVVTAIASALIWSPEIFMQNPMLLVVGFFVLYAGQQELMAVRRRQAMDEVLETSRALTQISFPWEGSRIFDFEGNIWDNENQRWVPRGQ